MSRLPAFGFSLRKRLARPYETLNTIEVSQSAILHNFDLLRSLHGTDIIPVLKSNTYGHGIMQVTAILCERTFPYIAVDGYFEALEIRKISKQPVLVMGSLGSNDIRQLTLNRAAYVVYSPESYANALGSSKPVTIHLEINTGMNRHGLSLEELGEVLQDVVRRSHIHVEGVMTHLADADNPDSTNYSAEQYRKFKKALGMVHEAGITPHYIHATNSAGTAKTLPKEINTVRPGIALYGVNPLLPGDKRYATLQKLRPALRFVSHIDQVQHLRKGDRISYNGIFTCPRDMRIGVVPVGYYEGLPRELSNKGKLMHGKHELPITGRVCMNHTMVDVTDSRLSVGDEVTVISPDRQHPNSVARLSEDYGLFNYSLLTGLASSTRRVIVD